MGAIRERAADRGLTLRILNSGHHYIFEGTGFLGEWWPSSAKLVFNKQWKRGVHCHAWDQVFNEIDKYLGETKRCG
jgi:hypothetical protein